jgi:hypothetical protein
MTGPAALCLGMTLAPAACKIQTGPQGGNAERAGHGGSAVAISLPPILAPDAPTSRGPAAESLFSSGTGPASRTPPRGTTEEPIVAVGGGEVLDEALHVEHYPGGDLLRTNPARGQVR